MRSNKGILALGLALLFCVFLEACGGRSPGPPQPNPVFINSVTLPAGLINTPYTTNVQAMGGTGPYTFSIISGSLPVGLSLASGGAITGTPTVVGPSSFTVQATDSKSATGMATLSINIEGVVLVTTTSLPNGAVGTAYSQALTATGGIPPYTWSLVPKATLPPGLTLSPQGVISGTPTTFGVFKFQVQAADSENPPARGTSAQISITIAGNLVISPTSLPQGTVNIAYNTQLTVTGGMAPYTWSYTGTLPPGLTLNASNGIISGVPTTAGAYPFTVTVVDAEVPPVMASANVSITIVPTPPLQITTTSLPAAAQGSAYIATLMASGGVPPYSWKLINGASLPPGLVMSISGVITGTPTASGTFPLTVQVSDTLPTDTPATAPLSLSVTAAAGPIIITRTLPAGLQNVAYQATLQATGGTPPYTWSIILGTLPAGLSLNASSGVISGTPSATGSSNIAVEVTDSTQHSSLPINMGVNIAAPISNASLMGSHAFSFNGYANGTPVLMAGSFVANGDGTFASGEFDINGSHGESTQTLITGAGQSGYAIQANGLGTMTFVTAQGTYNFSVAISATGNGRFIQNNSDPNTRGSGVIKGQTVAMPGKGNFSFGAFGGDSSGGRYASAGAFTMDSSENVTQGMQDTNDNGTIATTAFTGKFNAPDQNGRGTAVLTVAGTNYNYVYYSVSATEVVLLESDSIATVPISLGSVMLQMVSAGNGAGNTLLKGNSALELNAVDSGGSAAAVSLGLLTADGTTDGNGNGNISASFDENDGGTVSHQLVQGQYNVGLNGRTTITMTFAPKPPVLYVVSQNYAFVVGTDAVVTSGIVEPTLTASYGLSILGTYVGGTVTPALPSVTDEVDYIEADGSVLSGSGNTSGPGGTGTVNLSATYQVDASGRALLNGTPAGIAYVISPTKLVLLPTGATPVLSVFSGTAQ